MRKAPTLHCALAGAILLWMAPAVHAGCSDLDKSWEVQQSSGSAGLDAKVTEYFQDNIETYEDLIEKGLKWISEVRVSDYEVVDLDYVIPDAIYALDAVFPVTNCTSQDATQNITLRATFESTSSTSFEEYWESTTSFSLTSSVGFEGTGLESTFETSVTEGVSKGMGYEESTGTELERAASTTVPAHSGVYALLYVPNYVSESKVSGTFWIPDDAQVDVRWKHQDNDPHVCHHVYGDIKDDMDVNGDGVLGGTEGQIEIDFLSDAEVTNSNGSVLGVSVAFVAMDDEDYAYYESIQCEGFTTSDTGGGTGTASADVVVGAEIENTAALDAKYDFPATPE